MGTIAGSRHCRPRRCLDGMMYITQRLRCRRARSSDVERSGWYRYTRPRIASSVRQYRGLGILGTPCSWYSRRALIAIDRKGPCIWKTSATTKSGTRSRCSAVVKNKVIVAVAGEYGTGLHRSL